MSLQLAVPKHVETFRQSLRLLRAPRFGTYFAATLLSNIGMWSQQVAEPWLLLSLGASSFVIGLDSFVQSAPAFLLILAGGMLADNADRRWVVAKFQAIQMLCPVALVVLMLTHLIEPWMVIVLSLIVGITDALSMPSFQTIAPSLVRQDQIGSAIALNATQFNLSRILGPALGGLLIASVGAISCFVANAASYLPFIAVAIWILPPGSANPDPDRSLDRHQLLLGLRRIVASDYMRGALTTVLVTSTLCGPLIVFCPVLVKEILHGDSTQFSLAIGAFGIGGLLGAVVMLGVEPGRDKRQLSTAFAAAYGAMTAIAAVNPWTSVLPLLLVVAGFCMSISNTAANALLNAAAPARLRGRTISLYMLAMRGGLSFGGLLTGLSADLVGVRYALLANGIMAVTAQLILGRRWLRAGSEAASHPSTRSPTPRRC
ncbi:MFS transporter [Bradyrhizobium sp. UFLA03-84]|uniref:MFS transporter n=1 Tax=Bradyrhizobium sp. UFLA03-84 TaxID=418599 RepID=UPI000BADE426|nr:MFS transporter [Bradyrhizobium sp. UFLA03-84]PAY10770.1 MFS transporter [Bradyrhizobium sp. UFLA03-84]